MDVSLFSFGQFASVEKNHAVYLLLGDLYHLVAISISSQGKQVSCLTYEYVASQRERMLATPVCNDDGNCTSAKPVEAQLAVLQLSIFILASCLLFGADGEQRHFLAKLVSRLRNLFTKLGNWSEDQEASLRQFPGALLWCYATGVRFSDPKFDQKWFLIQFLGVTHAWMSDAVDEMLMNARMISGCLERIGKLSVE